MINKVKCQGSMRKLTVPCQSPRYTSPYDPAVQRIDQRYENNLNMIKQDGISIAYMK